MGELNRTADGRVQSVVEEIGSIASRANRALYEAISNYRNAAAILKWRHEEQDRAIRALALFDDENAEFRAGMEAGVEALLLLNSAGREAIR